MATRAQAVLSLHILGSGSKGNCSIVEGPGGLIMIDDGFSRREVLARMGALGLDAADVRAILVTHEHVDHVGGLPVWCRRFEGELLASAGTPAARPKISDLPFTEFEPGDVLELAGVTVETFSTSHDVADPVGFRFSCRGDSIGFATDTGCLTPDAARLLRGARIIALESNHDVHLLRTGPYPRRLQDRIASDVGHLSNDQAAQAAAELVTDATEQLVAMHISEENNRPSLAVRALARSLGAELDDELGSSATLARPGGLPPLTIRSAGQNRPITVS